MVSERLLWAAVGLLSVLVVLVAVLLGFQVVVFRANQQFHHSLLELVQRLLAKGVK